MDRGKNYSIRVCVCVFLFLNIEPAGSIFPRASFVKRYLTSWVHILFVELKIILTKSMSSKRRGVIAFKGRLSLKIQLLKFWQRSRLNRPVPIFYMVGVHHPNLMCRPVHLQKQSKRSVETESFPPYSTDSWDKQKTQDILAEDREVLQT